MAMNLTESSSNRRRHSIDSEINVTPFVDVMLVLLVIFMVTSPMMISGIDVDLPKTKPVQITGNQDPISITIDQEGNVYIQETKIKLDSLHSKLSALLKEKGDLRLFVRGDQKVDYGKVITVFAMVREVGFSNVALVTEVTNDK